MHSPKYGHSSPSNTKFALTVAAELGAVCTVTFLAGFFWTLGTLRAYKTV